jgi:hypothetical protein
VNHGYTKWKGFAGLKELHRLNYEGYRQSSYANSNPAADFVEVFNRTDKRWNISEFSTLDIFRNSVLKGITTRLSLRRTKLKRNRDGNCRKFHLKRPSR